jgi:peptidylprolyl isomerase
MNRFSFISLFSLTLLCSAPLLADDGFSSQEKEEAVAANENVDIPKLSEAFGHLIGKNMENLGLKFDMEKVMKGLKDAMAGKESPMTEVECVQAITSFQETQFKEQAEENLQKANVFMTKNAKESNVVKVEEGKLHYKVEQKGAGNEVLEHNSPLIRYVGKFLDGSVFGSSKEEETISLDETIPGISRGVIGMKEGEKRVIYIHPDLGYGTSSPLPPNSLLTFEIEIVKANSTQTEEQQEAISAAVGEVKPSSEIASPVEAPKAIR